MLKLAVLQPVGKIHTMKAVELGGPRTIIARPDILEVAKALQDQVAITPPERQVQLAAEGIDQLLGDRRSLYGARRVAISTWLTVVQKDYRTTCSSDEEMYDGLLLTDVRLRGEFSRFAFLKNPTLASLTLQLFEVQIADATETRFVGEHIHSGVHVPVMAARTVLPLE